MLLGDFNWILWVIGGGIIVTGWVIIRHKRRQARRRRVMAQPFPPEFRQILERNVPLYEALPDELQRQLEGLINVFLDEKCFEGCGGLEITDEVRVTIAAQACMLLLNRPTRFFRKLQTILVYPSTYQGHIGGGVSQARLGESCLLYTSDAADE